MTEVKPAGVVRYSFDNDDPEAVDRHRYLETILDPFTFARLSTVGDLTGLRCLEVGAGAGSVARWLANQVGATGRVLATDLNLRHIPADSGYTTLQHNLVTEPVPDGKWDLIHARLVLIHIPEREEILGRLADALAPGGALVVEEWAVEFTQGLVLNSPSAADSELFDAYQGTLQTLMSKRGSDATWAARTHSLMLRAGLTDVDTAIESRSWPGGTAGALLAMANVAQLRREFVDAGFTPEDIERLRVLVADPRLVLRGHFIYSTIGRKPRS